jgi:lysozyme family protein
VINKYSGVSFDAKTTSELIDKTSLPQSSTVTHHADQTALKSEYESLLNSLSVRKESEPELLRIQTDIEKNKQRYTEVETRTGVPWQVVAVLHYEEGALDFSRHLHNGDPLSERTVNPPSKRPRAGNPPFTWEDSAIDCLEFEGLTSWKDWSLAGILYKLEEFNGWSYRHHQINSPYLWGGSTHYTSGKVVADGAWSDSAVSKQLGAAVVLKALLTKHPMSVNQK